MGMGTVPSIDLQARGMLPDPRRRRQQAARIGVQRIVEDIPHRAALDDPPQVHDGDFIANLGDDAQIMRDIEHRHLELRLRLRDEVQNLRLHGDIKRSRRFIGDQQRRGRQDSAIAIITRWRIPPEK